MKTLLTILSTFVLLSCNKSNSTNAMEETQTQPLKAIPTASVNGKTITLSADKSTGPITSYGWALDVSSPTYPDPSNPVFITPLSWEAKKDDKGNWVLPILFSRSTTNVTKAGKYVFSLIVYDADKKQDYSTIEIEVK